MNAMKVLYLYAGPRRKIYDGWKKGREPDTYLVGLNYMRDYGIEADFLENRWTEFLRRISFNLTQIPALFYVKRYDIVFSGAGFGTLFLVKYILRCEKPRWVVYNTYLSNVLRRNPGGLKGWVIRKAIHSADAIVSPSQVQTQYLAREGIPDSKNFYVPYGVDENFYLSGISDRPTSIISERYIFSAGRDVGRDYKTLIDIAAALPVTVVIAAPPRSFRGIEDFPKNVTIHYFAAGAMPMLYAHAEISVIPTISEEKLRGSDCSGQYVLLESMVSGRAIITAARSTLPDYFTDRVHGLIVPPEDPKALKDAIVYLLEHPEETRRMGEEGQKKAHAEFTTKRFSAELAGVFKKISAVK